LRGRADGDASDRLEAAIYFTGTLLQRASLFLALPFLLRSLAAAEYGAFGLLQSAMNLLPAILALNLPATVTRLFFDGPTPLERRAIALKLTVLSASAGLITGLAVWGGAWALRPALATLLGISQRHVLLAATLVLAGALGSNHLQVAWGIWRADNRAARTAGANAANGLLFLAAVVALAATRRLGVVTAVAAYAGATAVVGLAANALAVLPSPLRGRASYASVAGEALRYGLPVLPYLLALWGLAAGGRWIARATLTLEDTGRFTLASQLAIMIGLIGRSAYDAWAPRSFAMFAGGRVESARAYLRARSRWTLAVVGGLGVMTAAALALGLPRFAPGYARVATLFPLFALAPVFDVAYMAHHTELMGLKVTRPIAGYTTVTVLLFLVAGVAGARAFGLWGLAAAYAGAYVVQWALAARAVRWARAHPAAAGGADGRVTLPIPSPLD
jgi:O-antigen/teichoic acid export membrane protein